MDAATREELNVLRRRAYGPAADIASDPVALARLAELEELALPEHPSSPRAAETPGPPDAAEPAASGPGADPATAPAAPDAAAEPPRPIRRLCARVLLPTAAVAFIAAAIAISSIALPQSPASSTRPSTAGVDATAPVHVPVMIRDATGTYVDLSWRPEAPAFPVDGEMAWAQPLGEYYGWSMWIGAAESGRRDQRCLLITSASGTRGRCVEQGRSADGELAMSLPATRIEPADRPAGMTDDQRLRFSWNGGGYVTVEVTTRVRD